MLAADSDIQRYRRAAKVIETNSIRLNTLATIATIKSCFFIGPPPANPCLTPWLASFTSQDVRQAAVVNRATFGETDVWTMPGSGRAVASGLRKIRKNLLELDAASSLC
jgi:hypothetical protein